MLKVRVIPCMLFNGFSLVKTIQFGTMRNLGSPIQAAHVYNSRNVDELVFIDLKATEEHREPLYDVIHEVIGECFMPLAIGGGIHSLDVIQKLLSIGADKVIINSEALTHPEFIERAARKFGSQCIVVSIDVKRNGRRFMVMDKRGATTTRHEAVPWAQEMHKRGAGELFVTSVDQDGSMAGYDIDLINAVVSEVSIPVIASGGAGKVQDIIDVIKKGHADAAALASMFHYSGHTANSIKQRMAAAGIPVRIVGP